MEIQQVDLLLRLYIAAELPAFHSKIKNQVIIIRISLFLFEFLTNERDRKFRLIQIFSNRKCFYEMVGIYSIINYILKYILLITSDPLHSSVC